MNFPTLYKKSSAGKILMWEIDVKDRNGHGVITVVHGQLGGKLQSDEDVVTEGKNIGKANETHALGQAYLEATSKWEKQLKAKGYVKTIAEAEAGERDELVEGGIMPMLAHTYSKRGDKISFPALVQPKFDGHRCTSQLEKDGTVTLWSRTRKIITGLPHINKALEELYRKNKPQGGVLDGELYRHDYKANFEALTHFIRSPEPQAGCEAVQFHIYDYAIELGFADRSSILNGMLKKAPSEYLVPVETIEVADEDEMQLAFDRFLLEGYEGLMIRNMKGAYAEGKRSTDLQKVKEFIDGEFQIIGVEEGRGKMAGKAIFICISDHGTAFRVKMKGALSGLKKYVDNPKLCVGRMLTVQYQGMTGKNNVPRFPVGLRFHEAL